MTRCINCGIMFNEEDYEGVYLVCSTCIDIPEERRTYKYRGKT